MPGNAWLGLGKGTTAGATIAFPEELARFGPIAAETEFGTQPGGRAGGRRSSKSSR